MQEKKIEWSKEIIQTCSDLAGLSNDIGIPGIGLLAKFAQHFCDVHLQKRFVKFLSNAEIDNELINRITENENYSNGFYAALETIRQTHSKVGVIALALIYKDHWNNEVYLIGAMRAFSQVSDKALNAFISLYESIPSDKNYMVLQTHAEGETHFHELYNEGH